MKRILLAAPLMLLAAATGRAAPARTPPNVIVILADDLGAGELGCYGNKQNRTPNLDRLARTGAMFRTCWATPLCSPTRVELLTGRYAFRTGWYNLIGRDFTPGDHLDPDEPTIADMMKARGYATCMVGKWQLGMITRQPTMIFDSGFDEYCAWAWKALPAGSDFAGDSMQRYWHPALIVNGRHLPTTPNQYGPDVQNDWLIEFIRKNRKRPFFAYYAMCPVHEPWDPTPSLDSPGMRTAGGLQANIEYMDHLVGLLVKALEEMELRDNTVILFTGDNGTGGAGKGKVTERGVRVPLIVNAPGLVQPVLSDELVDLSDILPTVADLTGATPPAGVTIDGWSFAGFLRGKPGRSRPWIFSYLRDQRMLRDRKWLLEGDGRFYDCGYSRDGTGYVDVTGSSDPEVVAARKRFDDILANLPAPTASKPAGKGSESSSGNKREEPLNRRKLR